MYKHLTLSTFLIMSFFLAFAQPSQYTPMTAQGYQFKRILTDSTLHLPSFCGVPTLRNSTAKNGALAIDTCNNRLYQWTNSAGWTNITSGGIDTTSLSNRIDARVKYTDTAVMLLPYLRKVDTISMLSKYLRKVDTTAMLNPYLRKIDTANMLTPYLRKIDTANMLTPYLRKIDTTAMLSKYLRKIDTTAMLSKYLRKIDTTDMLTPYLRKIDTANMLTPYLRKIDTTAMLSKYLRKIDTTAMLNPYLRKIDTTNKYVSNVVTVDDTTFRVFKGSTSTDIVIHAGGGSVTTPDLQAVTSVGATTDQMVTMSQYGGLFQNEYNKTAIVGGLVNFYPFYSAYTGANNIIYIQGSESPLSQAGNEFEYYNGNTSGDHVKINPDLIELSSQGTGANVRIVTGQNTSSDNHYLPIADGITDTLATLADVRAGGGGGGGGSTGRFGNDTATIVMAKIHNNSGTTLTNGKVVFLATSGTNSDAPSVRLANNKHDSTSANTFGFVTGSIANNDTGYIILSGLIEKLNTSAFANGDIIYLDSISGNWTKTKPVAPYHMVYLGVVVKSNAGNGSIFVKCQNGYELDEIHDVQITNKVNNQILAYSDTQKVWKNRNVYSIVDTTTTIATKTNLTAKLNISDTSVFQRKNIAANSFMANNTNAAANVTNQTYIDNGDQNITGTITVGGTTAPTSLTSATYQWQQVGKTVTFTASILYVNAGTGNTSLNFPLPTDMPAPHVPTGWSGANTFAYTGIISTHGSNILTSSATGVSSIRRNSGNTGWDIQCAFASTAVRGLKITLTYRVP